MKRYMMKIQVEHNNNSLYDYIVQGDLITVVLSDDGDEVEVSLNDTVTVHEIHQYVIENLHDLFKCLKAKDTIVLDLYHAEEHALLYNGPLTMLALDSDDWFEYSNNSCVLIELISKDFICKLSKPQEMTFKQLITKYEIPSL